MCLKTSKSAELLTYDCQGIIFLELGFVGNVSQVALFFRSLVHTKEGCHEA